MGTLTLKQKIFALDSVPAVMSSMVHCKMYIYTIKSDPKHAYMLAQLDSEVLIKSNYCWIV